MKSATRRLRSFFGLPPDERLVLVQAWAWLFVAHVALHLVSFRRVLSVAERVVGQRPGSLRHLSSERLAQLVEIAGRHAPMRTTCLTEALALSWILRRRGLAGELRIGVARHDGALVAHAWLEASDGPIGELSDVEPYAALQSRPQGPRVRG